MPLKEATPGMVTLYQVTPPSLVRRMAPLPTAQPLNASTMCRPRIMGEKTMVPGITIGVFVGVTVGGTWLDISKRTIVGALHVTRSFVAEPVARIIKMKRTFCPANGLRFTSNSLFFL